MVKIAVLVSGGGTNLQALIDAQNKVIKSGKISLVISNKEGAYALERAKKAGIESKVVLKKELGSQEAFEEKIIEILEKYNYDYVDDVINGMKKYDAINKGYLILISLSVKI